MENEIANLITGFRKSYGTQRYLVIMLENGNELLIKG